MTISPKPTIKQPRAKRPDITTNLLYNDYNTGWQGANIGACFLVGTIVSIARQPSLAQTPPRRRWKIEVGTGLKTCPGHGDGQTFKSVPTFSGEFPVLAYPARLLIWAVSPEDTCCIPAIPVPALRITLDLFLLGRQWNNHNSATGVGLSRRLETKGELLALGSCNHYKEHHPGWSWRHWLLAGEANHNWRTAVAGDGIQGGRGGEAQNSAGQDRYL